ncbi:MAG: nucleotidyltransferase domain-containing protein [Nitrospinota bacterium]
MHLSEYRQLHLNEFAYKNGIKFIILFGSQADKTSRERSDFDIAVFTSNTKNIDKLEEYNNVLFGISKILCIPDYKIDLTNLNNADPLLRYEITSNGLLLYGNEVDYLSFKSFAFKDYIETKDLRILEKRLIFKRQKLIAEKIYA